LTVGVDDQRDVHVHGSWQSEQLLQMDLTGGRGQQVVATHDDQRVCRQRRSTNTWHPLTHDPNPSTPL